MPIGPENNPELFDDFEECWTTVLESDDWDVSTEEEAKRLCGSWQDRVEGNVQLAVNELGDVRRVEEDGKEWLVAPATFLKNMTLHKGYVPKEEVAKATERWDGTPIVPDHPRVGPKTFISVNSPMADEPTFGEIRSPKTEINGTAATSAEAWFDVQAAHDIGGEPKRIVNGLEDGKSFGVSSAYGGDDLPPGEYDGQKREKVKGNLRPDHVAVFANKNGRCTLRDGCGVGEIAADDVSANEVMVNVSDDGSGSSGNTTPEDTEEPSSMTDDLTVTKSIGGITFDGVDDGVVEPDDIPDDDFEDHFVFANETKDASAFPLVDGEGRLRRGNVELAFNSLEHAPDQDELLSVLKEANKEFSDPPIDDGAFEEVSDDSMIGNLLGFLGLSTNNDSAETEENTMSERTEVLVNEHGFDEENLPSEDTECFDRIYDLATNDASEDEDVTVDDGDEDDDEPSGFDADELIDRMEDRFVTQDDLEDTIGEALAANKEQRKKEDLADEIIANSDDYDEDDKETLVETPDTVLEDIHRRETASTGTADYRGFGGASSAQPSGVSDADSMPALSANARIEEKEAGD